ncbi:MAG TPA: hypothetical protein VFH95_06940 [Candidatus Kapabacteria bacterium]|nr:hypothetical protein [Candidatus Kapabacteria bacterium]
MRDETLALFWKYLRGSRLAARGSRLALECAIALACLSFSRLAASTQYVAPSSNSSKHTIIDRLSWDHVEGFCLADSIGKEIYAGSRNRLYHTTDSGKTWTKLGELPNITLIKEIIPISRARIFVNTSKGFDGTAFLSVDSGHTFCQCVPSTGEGACAWFLRDKGVLYVASQKPFCIMESKDSGISWTIASHLIDTLKKPDICSMLVKDTKFYISTSLPPAIYYSSDLDEPWKKIFTDPLFTDSRMPSNREVPLVTKWGNRLVACVASGPHGSRQQLYISDNDGNSWRGIDCPFIIWGIGVNNVDTSTMWIGNYGNSPWPEPHTALRYSRDNGRTWNMVPNCGASIFWRLEELPDHSLYAATDFGLIRVKLNE